jgi:thiamine biosynthesis lipoprotein
MITTDSYRWPPPARRFTDGARRTFRLWLGIIAGGMVVGGGVWGQVARAAAAEAELQRFEATQTQMGVPFKIVLYAADESTANAAFQAAFAHVARLNSILSDYDPQSELTRLSQAAPMPRPVEVSLPLWTVLQRSQALAEQSDGAFDVTVGPLVRLWRRARRGKQMPAPHRLADARAAVGYRLLRLDAEHRTVQLIKPGMRLDLGGIAMGYAVDETLRLLRGRGMARALVDASGDIAVGDPPPDKPGWTIDVMPLSADGTPSRTVRLANAAVTTAGDAHQHVVLGGIRYSHIVDPRTGLGLTDQVGVAVIAGDCLTADSLDTAASVLGPEAGLRLIESTPGAGGFIVRPRDQGDPEIWESAVFRRFVIPAEK